jgi:hypothetical protein
LPNREPPIHKIPLAALSLTAAVVLGCGPSSAILSPSVAPASDGAVRVCEDRPLRDPAGQPVFLGGRWIGSGDPNALPAPSVFLLRQTNSCLTWVGLSATEGEALGASWVESFSGQIDSDFRIRGLWEEVPDGGRGAITVDIVLVPVDGAYEAELMLTDWSGDTHLTKRWVRESADR